MINVEKLDDELYRAFHNNGSFENALKLWSMIKGDPTILREAVQVKKDKFGERDIVRGIAIASTMLMDFENVDEEAYDNLIEAIYTNKDIARIVAEGASNGGYSFLLMSLWNPELKLTEEQKAFAVDEAMNKSGTIRFKQNREEFSKMLDEIGVSDEKVTVFCGDGFVTPVGRKTASEYAKDVFNTLSTKQAHGVYPYDIRYQILKNSNWTREEKEILVREFFADDQFYDDTLDEWEWGIINNPINSCDGDILIDKSSLYDYSLDTLTSIFKGKGEALELWSEIAFCREMHEIRPNQAEKGKIFEKNKTTE